MITLEIQNKKYEMPNSWSEVNLEQYIKLMEIISQKDKGQLYLLVEIISYLADIDINTLRNADIDDIDNIDIQWITEKPNNELLKEVEINGKKYKLIENLNQLTLGEYVDLEEYNKDVIKNLHYIAAIIMREENDGKIVDSDDVEIRAKLFYRYLNIEQLIGITNFFLNGKKMF